LARPLLVPTSRPSMLIVKRATSSRQAC
jgi:hypothetical protein